MSPLGDLGDWQRVAATPDLLDAGAAVEPGDANAIARLRKRFSPEHVRIALLIAEARRKLARKFPVDVAGALIADPEAAEMASSDAASRHKAERFRRSLARASGAAAPILDLCSGLGADARALARVAGPVLGIDRDPVRAWMTSVNAGHPARAAPVEDVLGDIPPTALVHIDPARRTSGPSGSRTARLEDLLPAPQVILSAVAGAVGAAVKLAPGTEIEDARDHLLPPGTPHELEVLSEGGRLTQAILWTGLLADDHLHRATLLPGGESLTGPARIDGRTTGGAVGGYIFAADPAVERARLLWTLAEQVGAEVVHPRLGLLTHAETLETPFAAGFAVLEDLPWNERRVRAALHALGGGVVEVKTRGKLVDPNALQARLRGPGDRVLTLFVLRFDRSPRALVCERLARREDGGATAPFPAPRTSPESRR